MILKCINCRCNIVVSDETVSLEGKLIKCLNCKEEWIYHSETFFLESRLLELEQDLNKKELQINDQNTEYSKK